MTVDIELDLGMSTWGQPHTTSLARAPHLLVAGMTGSGKSVFVHSLITQLLNSHAPSRVAFALIDPKRVEFAPYRGVPHLVNDPVYETHQIAHLLEWSVSEMHARFTYMEARGWRDVRPGPWPRLVVVIDELANLLLADRKRFERPIVQLASMGRAAGIHLILATQRPSADVITGLIRANVPTRVCMPVISRTESRIILDAPGGETLKGPGSMLIRQPGERELVKAFGYHTSDADIDRLCGWLRAWGAAA